MDHPALHIVPPQTTHTHTAILLHGRSGNGPDFASELFSGKTSAGKNLPSSLPSWRWVFPSSLQRHDTSIQSHRPAWFDAYSLTDIDERQDLQLDGLKESVRYILGVIEDEIVLVNGDPQRIVLGGFSQGNATSLWTFLSSLGRFPTPLGGYLGLCGWLPFNSRIKQVLDEAYAVGKEEPSLSVTDFVLDKLGVSQSERERRIQQADDGAKFRIPTLHVHHEDDIVISPDLGAAAHAVLCRMLLRASMRMVGGFTAPDYEGHWIGEPFGFDEIVQFLGGVVLGQVPSDL